MYSDQFDPNTEPDSASVEQLTHAARTIHPDPRFVKALGTQLRAHHPAKRPTASLRWLPAAAALLLLMVGVLFFVTPTGSAFAESVSAFFRPGEDDTTVVQAVYRPDHDAPIVEAEGTSAESIVIPAPPVVTLETIPPVARSAAPVLPTEFAQTVPFDIWLPDFLPASYQLEDAEYHPLGPLTHLEFYCTTNSIWRFGLRQRQISPAQLAIEYDAIRGEVGASAVIEQIPLRNITAEFMAGDWIPTSIPDFSDTQTSAPMQMEWENDVPFYRLTWYEDGYLFQLYTTGGLSVAGADAGDCATGREVFVSLAESMK